MQGKPLVLLLSVLYGSAFIAGFNENLVNMALVSIMAEYGVDSVTAQWLVTGYMIVATVVVTCMAFLYRRFHVRTLFFGAAGLSIVGSAMGLVAPSFELLLVARLVQAVGTGIFIPLMMNTILVVTPKNKLGTYLSVGGCMITFGPAFAPVVCGALVTAFGWHSIFFVPIVAMAVLTVLGFFYMKNLETHEAHLDVLSVLLSAVALTVLSFGLTQLTTDGVLAAAALVLAAAMVAVFVVRQLRCAHPLIDLAPMKNRAFWPALILVTIAMMSMFSMSVLLPLYFEGAAGMTAFAAGLVILVPVLANAGATLLGGRIMDKRGEWPLLPLGFGGIAVGFIALVAVAPQLSVPAVFAAMLVMYVAVGFIFSPSQTAGLRALPPRQNPFGVALMTTFVQIAACIGPSLYIGIMSSGQAGAAASGASAAQATADGFALAMAVAAAIGVVGFALALAYARAARKRAAVQAVERAAQPQALSVLASIMEADPYTAGRHAGARGDARVRGFEGRRVAAGGRAGASGGLRVRRRCDALPSRQASADHGIVFAGRSCQQPDVRRAPARAHRASGERDRHRQAGGHRGRIVAGRGVQPAGHAPFEEGAGGARRRDRGHRQPLRRAALRDGHLPAGSVGETSGFVGRCRAPAGFAGRCRVLQTAGRFRGVLQDAGRLRRAPAGRDCTLCTILSRIFNAVGKKAQVVKN